MFYSVTVEPNKDGRFHVCVNGKLRRIVPSYIEAGLVAFELERQIAAQLNGKV